MNEYEFYAQDSWRLGRQADRHRRAPVQPGLAAVGDQRPAGGAERESGRAVQGSRGDDGTGIPENTLPDIQFVLAGPENGRKGFYDWDKNNFAPGVCGGLDADEQAGRSWRLLARLRPHRSRPRAATIDAAGSFGLSTSLTSPFGGTNEDDPSVRFQGINVLPSSVPAAPPGGFPQTPPRSADIYVDDRRHPRHALRAQLQPGGQLRAHAGLQHRSGVCRKAGRNLLVQRDLTCR